MSRLERDLYEGEEIIMEAKITKIPLIKAIVRFVLAGVFLLAIIPSLVGTVTYAFTNASNELVGVIDTASTIKSTTREEDVASIIKSITTEEDVALEKEQRKEERKEYKKEVRESFFSSLPYLMVIVVVMVFNIIKVVAELLKYLNNNLCYTNKRVMGKVGVFSTEAVDIPLEKVDHVKVNTPFWGRIFHYASISICFVTWDGVANATEMKNALNEAVEKYKDIERRKQAQEFGKAMNGEI